MLPCVMFKLSCVAPLQYVVNGEVTQMLTFTQTFKILLSVWKCLTLGGLFDALKDCKISYFSFFASRLKRQMNDTAQHPKSAPAINISH